MLFRKFIFSVILVIGFVGAIGAQTESDCNNFTLEDPLFNFEFDENSCDGSSGGGTGSCTSHRYSVCLDDYEYFLYDFTIHQVLYDGYSYQLPTNPNGPTSFSNIGEMATALNWINDFLEVDDISFETFVNDLCVRTNETTATHPINGTIYYLIGTADGQQDLELKLEAGLVSENIPCSDLDTDVITDYVGSEIPDDLINDEPTLSGTFINDNGEEESWSLSGQDIADGDGIGGTPGTDNYDPDYTGPDANTLGYLFGASAGLLNSAGCENINCANLPEIIEELFNAGSEDPETESTESAINDLFGEYDIPDDELPDDYETWAEYIEEETAAAMEEKIAEYGGLAQFINAHSNLNLNTADCPDGDMFPNLTGGDNENKSQGNSKMMDEPPLEIDYFSKEIPGLSESGPGAAAPSPSSLKMIDQVNAGVNLYNGSQSTSIPLYNLQSNDISIPISVSSTNGNGLKVNDIGSVMGQNWKLDAGGMISRVVKGLPDEFNGTTHGRGVGKYKDISARIEAPSNVGFDIDIKPFPGENACEPLTSKIKFGFNETLLDNGGVKITTAWTPLRINLVTFNLAVKVWSFEIPLTGPEISVYAQIGWNVGLNLNEEFGHIDYHERGIGYFNSDDGGFNLPDFEPHLTDLTEKERIEILRKATSHRRDLDTEFFSDQLATWDAWIEAFSNENDDYNSQKIDTEPDEFYFNFGGYSGKIMFTADREPIIFPAQDLDVTVHTATSASGDEHISSFVIETPQGMRYTFGGDAGSPKPFYGVDFTENQNFYLPNFYTYPETGVGNNKFEGAKIDQTQMVWSPLIGPKRTSTWGNTYDRNYKVMNAPRFSSAWHLISVESLLTLEEVTLHYEKQPALRYNADKSYSHTMPNFRVDGNIFRSETNGDLNNLSPWNILPTKWEHGRAEFAYNVTETTLERWDLQSISGQRQERIDFTYYEPGSRAEIVDDHVLHTIKVKRADNLYKGWQFNYGATNGSLNNTVDCNEDVFEEELNAPAVSVANDNVYNLGTMYELKNWEYHNYFFFNISIPCFRFGIRFPRAYNVLDYLGRKHWGHKTQMSEFGSVMEVKALSKMFFGLDLEAEAEIFNAEFKRTFLQEIQELGKSDAAYDFVKIDYKNFDKFEGEFPKRFSTEQDLFGYWNRNLNGTLLPAVTYRAIENQSLVTQPQGHFGFYNEAAPNSMHLGQNITPSFWRASTGSIQQLTLATGGNISYRYALNEMPSSLGIGTTGAGVRVASMTEDPAGMPAKTTEYLYEDPGVTVAPVRVYQHPRNVYYKSLYIGGPNGFIEAPQFCMNLESTEMFEALEEKVESTSSIQNNLYSNKNNYVGYGKVTEKWAGIGEKQHFFRKPFAIDCVPNPDFQDSGNESIASADMPCEVASTPEAMREIRMGYFDDGGLSTCIDDLNLSYHYDNNFLPGLRHSTFYRDWAFGYEYQTDTYAEGGQDLRQRTQYTHSVVNLGEKPKQVSWFKTSLTQNNYLGRFQDRFFSRLIESYQPFAEPEVNTLVSWVIDLIQGSFFHPYKKIERNYFIAKNTMKTGNLRLDYSVTTNYFGGTNNQSVQTAYTYGGANNLVLSNTSTVYKKGAATDHTTAVEHQFITDDGADIDDFDNSAVTHLTNIGYTAPVVTTTLQDGTPIGKNYTALGMEGGRIVPVSSWTMVNGEKQLAGVFSEYDTHGKPTVYRQSEFGNTDVNAGEDMFFPPMTFTRNNRLQPTGRTYAGFSTNTTYKPDSFEPWVSTDADGIGTTYEFDDRGRLMTVDAMSAGGSGAIQTTTYDYQIMTGYGAGGENSVQTTLSFADGAHPDQITKQYTDGFGRPTALIRENDGAELSAVQYDAFFRPVSSAALGRGVTTTEYEPGTPISYVNTTTDAVGNVTVVTNLGADGAFTHTQTEDANESITHTYTDALGRTEKTILGEGGVTLYDYTDFNQIEKITNPNEELYEYSYNDMGQVISKTVPGSGAHLSWYDTRYQLAATLDANGNGFSYEYDDLGRVKRVSYHENSGGFGTQTVVPENSIGGGVPAKVNEYAGNTWSTGSKESLFTPDGVEQLAKKTALTIDALGRMTASNVTYPQGSVSTNISGLTDAGTVTSTDIKIGGGETETVSVSYQFGFDGILRPTTTDLSCNSMSSKRVSALSYNGYDQVTAKGLGNIGGTEYLQTVNYAYDAAGRLLTINSPQLWECTEGEEGGCTLTAEFSVRKGKECRFLNAVSVNGTVSIIQPPLDIYVTSDGLQQQIEATLASAGATGNVTVTVTNGSGGYDYTVTVDNSDAEEITLYFDNCKEPVVFVKGDCCEGGFPTTEDPVFSSPNGALYYQTIAYDGLNIKEISLGNGCKAGQMLNQYTYDLNHRVTDMKNTLFAPDPIGDAYSTHYEYDPLGNITYLKRRGLKEIVDNVPFFTDIDELTYGYNGPFLESIKDATANPSGFRPEISTFTPDGNGNIVSDSGKGISVKYNPLNLPKTVGGESGDIGYTYALSGEKVVKKTSSSNPEEEEKRIYLGGAEFKDGKAESYYFGDGRVLMLETEPDRPQYNITDHLGNTVVTFEDRDEDGMIVTEAEETEEFAAEVVQRNLYYPFGLAQEGCWKAEMMPEMNYLYNGKEVEKDLGLDWSFYGFRMYDAAVGRFTGVDPIADRFAFVSTYNYAENRPIDGIDLWGLQYYNKTSRVGVETSGNFQGLELHIKIGRHRSTFTRNTLRNVRAEIRGYGTDDDFLSVSDIKSYQRKDNPARFRGMGELAKRNHKMPRGNGLLLLIQSLEDAINNDVIADLSVTSKHLENLDNSITIVKNARLMKLVPGTLEDADLVNFIQDNQLPSTGDDNYANDIEAMGTWLYNNKEAMLNETLPATESGNVTGENNETGYPFQGAPYYNSKQNTP